MPNTPRLKVIYEQEVKPGLMEEFGYKNPMAVPTLYKVVLNMGVGEASREPKLLEEAVEEMSQIAGQRPTVRRSRKAISNFKLRENQPVGVAATLRSVRMWEFVDRLINLSLPRVRDFRGVSARAFDGRGNYCLGVKDQLIFPEINYAKVQRAIGMNITIVTSANSDAEARSLLTRLGMPFVR